MVCALIPGWQIKPSIWQHSIDALASQGIEATALALPERPDAEGLRQWYESLAGYRVLVGWSLGAALILEALNTGCLQDKQVLLVCCGGAFSRQGRWQHSLSATQWSRFVTRYQTNPQMALKRFMQLQAQGTGDPVSCCQQAGKSMRQADRRHAGEWLYWMQDWVAPDQSPRQAARISVLAGGGDCIVPESASRELAEAYACDFESIPAGGHMPFLAEVKAFQDWLWRQLAYTDLRT